MENLLRTIIDQNERLIAAVEAVGERIEYFQNSIRADLTIADSSSRVASIDDKLGEIAGALEIFGDRSLLKEILEELGEVRSAVDLLDSTVQTEAEGFKK